MLCVSIHDVAPATWDDCARLAAALREVADIPLSWLVVPRYHDRPADDAAMRAGLDAALARGDELVLHGLTHLDTEARAASLRQRFLRGVYTQREGEFAALSAAEARRRLALGLDWFRERGWTASGFVPPAWLMGEGAWEALGDFPFAYTTTFMHFHLLGGKGDAAMAASAAAAGSGDGAGGHIGAGASADNRLAARRSATPFGPALFAPSLVYAARNRSGRFLSPLAAGLAARWQAGAPLVRLSLHPPDVRHPRLLAHARRLVEQMVRTRHAVTKASCAAHYKPIYQPIYQPRPQNPPRQPGPQPPYGP
nr:polysaccharide deacetylase family protein [Massilia brevitalea]